MIHSIRNSSIDKSSSVSPLFAMVGECVELGGSPLLHAQKLALHALPGKFLAWSFYLLSIAALALVYGTVFKVQDFNTYIVYLGLGLVVWNGISSAIALL